jgi:hypothetical protein
MNVIKGSSIGLMSIVLHSDAQAQCAEDTIQLERMIFYPSNSGVYMYIKILCTPSGLNTLAETFISS